MIHLTRKKRKPKYQELVMFFPVFSNFKVRVIIAPDTVAAAYYIADRDYIADPQITDYAEAFTCSNSNNGWSIIYLTPDAMLGTIAHETYHAVTAMMKMIGAAEEHEVVAYHLGYIVNKIVEFNLKVAPRLTKGKKDVSKS